MVYFEGKGELLSTGKDGKEESKIILKLHCDTVFWDMRTTIKCLALDILILKCV